MNQFGRLKNTIANNSIILTGSILDIIFKQKNLALPRIKNNVLKHIFLNKNSFDLLSVQINFLPKSPTSHAPRDALNIST